MDNSQEVIMKRRKQHFSSQEKVMIHNSYDTFLKETPQASKNDIAKTIASSLGIHWVSVHRIVNEKQKKGVLKSPIKQTTRKSVISTTDSFTENAIRRIIHGFFSRNEIPSLDKILAIVNDDASLANYRRTTFHKLLKHMGFKFVKRTRNSMMTDREDLEYWRRNYLQSIKEARNVNKKIFYLDETWVNEGHTNNKIWVDSSIQNARQAFMNGLSVGLKNPSGKIFHSL